MILQISRFEPDHSKLSLAVARVIRSTSSSYSAFCCMELETDLLQISESSCSTEEAAEWAFGSGMDSRAKGRSEGNLLTLLKQFGLRSPRLAAAQSSTLFTHEERQPRAELSSVRNHRNECNQSPRGRNVHAPLLDRKHIL